MRKLSRPLCQGGSVHRLKNTDEVPTSLRLAALRDVTLSEQHDLGSRAELAQLSSARLASPRRCMVSLSAMALTAMTRPATCISSTKNAVGPNLTCHRARPVWAGPGSTWTLRERTYDDLHLGARMAPRWAMSPDPCPRAGRPSSASPDGAFPGVSRGVPSRGSRT